jgi:non-heme chloroperoxidase
MADLAGRGLRCVGYDRRGHGRSGEPSHGYEFDTLADELDGLRAILGAASGFKA